MLLVLLAIGTGHDLWRARGPIPRPGAAAPEAPSPRSPAETTAAPGRAAGAGAVLALDLNRAGVAELDALPGIGPVLARRIVEHRTRHGPFRRVEELRAVRGVGPRLLERLRARVIVGETTRVVP